jgi:hypothetical protein
MCNPYILRTVHSTKRDLNVTKPRRPQMEAQRSLKLRGKQTKGAKTRQTKVKSQTKSSSRGNRTNPVANPGCDYSIRKHTIH